MTVTFGCIADDFTGATDLAALLARSGAEVSLRIGVPDDDPQETETSAIEVVALKCRTSPVADAVAAGRFHHQWLPDQIYLEEDCIDQATRNKLIEMGYTLKERDPIGKVEVILISDDGSINAAGDPRGDDTAWGR